VELGKQLRHKASFLRISVVLFGIPCAALLVWQVGASGDMALNIIIVFFSLAGGWLWGTLMWKSFVKNFLQIDAKNEHKARD
jgi:hypothetical protein